MILLGLTSVLFSMIFVMPLMLQPLSLGGWIMVVALFCSLMMGLECSPWFGYILFLTYVGGLLVMFAYVVALSPNVMFFGVGSIKLVLGVSLVFVFMNLGVYSSFYKNIDVSMYSIDEVFESFSGVLVVSNNSLIFVSLSVILFLALVGVVKICYYQEGPLRSFKWE